ncbi:MAG: GNAT family N-acetyltransferase [Clostridiaceae bacterium]|nr:GNAT family N-acetyltransferase [Eubacteriales bacterium]
MNLPETERLILRKMDENDLPALRLILQDEKAMYAYEHAFSEEETVQWLNRQLERYEKYGFGLWAAVLKANGEMIGQCGLTMQAVPNGEVLEIGYLFQRVFWHKGYATEAARACKAYAFDVLNADEVFSIVRDTNYASQNVARRNGMRERGRFIKHYWGVDMPHILFSVKKGEG